eukprot:5664392-Pleurochrysis_carterae.AAC.1
MRPKHHRRWGRAPWPCAVRVTDVVLGVGVVCMATAEAGVLQLSVPGVLASVGCSGLAMSSARGAYAAS